MKTSADPPKWPVILLFFMAIGVPTAAAFTFAQTITQHPWQALGIALLYEIGVGIVGILSKIWGILEKKWVERIATWLDESIQVILTSTRTRRQYCRNLFYEHRNFDIKGLSTQSTYTLELEQVFVELSVDPSTIQDASNDPLQLVKQPGRQHNAERNTIWYYLNSPTLTTQHFAIIGPPGSGKTTILKHLALTLISHKNSKTLLKKRRLLPILLYLL